MSNIKSTFCVSLIFALVIGVGAIPALFLPMTEKGTFLSVLIAGIWGMCASRPLTGLIVSKLGIYKK